MSEIENWKESLDQCIPFSARDWALDKRDAWVYGIIIGWEDEDTGDINEKIRALFLKRFSWKKDTGDRLIIHR